MTRLGSLLWAVAVAFVFAGAGLIAMNMATVAGVAPLVGPGHVDSFTVSCGTSATLIQSPFGQVSYSAFVDDAASADVAFGDSGVTTATGEPKGAGERTGGNVRAEYCRSTSAQTIRVRAMVATDPNSFTGGFLKAFHETFYPEMFEARLEG